MKKTGSPCSSAASRSRMSGAGRECFVCCRTQAPQSSSPCDRTTTKSTQDSCSLRNLAIPMVRQEWCLFNCSWSVSLDRYPPCYGSQRCVIDIHSEWASLRGHVTAVTVTVAAILTALPMYLQVQLSQLIRRSGICRLHPQVPNHQSSYIGLTTW